MALSNELTVYQTQLKNINLNSPIKLCDKDWEEFAHEWTPHNSENSCTSNEPLSRKEKNYASAQAARQRQKAELTFLTSENERMKRQIEKLSSNLTFFSQSNQAQRTENAPNLSALAPDFTW